MKDFPERSETRTQDGAHPLKAVQLRPGNGD